MQCKAHAGYRFHLRQAAFVTQAPRTHVREFLFAARLLVVCSLQRVGSHRRARIPTGRVHSQVARAGCAPRGGRHDSEGPDPGRGPACI